MEEFNINDIVVGFLTENLEKFVKSSKNVIKGTSEKIRLQLDSTYKKYLITVTDKYSKAKSFFIRNELVPFIQLLCSA